MQRISYPLCCTILESRFRKNHKTGEFKKINKRAMLKKCRSRKRLYPRSRRRRKKMMTRDPKLPPWKIFLSRRSFLKSTIKAN